MAKYRKKPVVIEAMQFVSRHPDGSEVVHAYDPQDPRSAVCFLFDYAKHPDEELRPHVHTLEGAHFVSEGDWIITGVQGERYPCKPDIFEATYETAEPSSEVEK